MSLQTFRTAFGHCDRTGPWFLLHFCRPLRLYRAHVDASSKGSPYSYIQFFQLVDFYQNAIRTRMFLYDGVYCVWSVGFTEISENLSISLWISSLASIQYLRPITPPSSLITALQSNFDGSNPFGIMKICSRQR